MRLRVTTLLALALFAAGPAASARAQTTDLSPAAQTLSRCVQAQNRLSVLLLVDESQSLRNTDPLHQRTAGLRAALTGLSRLASTPVNGKQPSVEILMATFAGGANPDPEKVESPAWRPVNEQELDALLAQAGELGERDDGHGTNYGVALQAARTLLTRQAGEQSGAGQGRTPCKALIWFTDGKYTVPDLSEGQLANRKRELCRPGGLMDRMAQDGIVKFTVALSSNELQGAESDFLTALTTGKGGEGCGADLSEETGQFLPVADSDSLLFAFSSFLLPGVDPTPGNPCQEQPCEDPQKFTTVPGLTSFVIDAATGAEGVDIALIAPNDTGQTLEPGGQPRLDVSGTPVTQRWVSGRAVEIVGDLARGGSGAEGEWEFAFIDPQGRGGEPKYTLRLFTDIGPALAERGPLVRGEDAEVTFTLARGDGTPATSGPLVEAAQLTAQLKEPDKPATPIELTPAGPGRFTGTVTVPAASTAAAVNLDVEATFPVDGVTSIVPQNRSFRLLTKPPENQGLPTIVPSELQLPSVKGDGSTSANLTITGSKSAAGCVRVSMEDLKGPDGDPVTAEFEPNAAASSGCPLKVAKGEVKTLKVTLTPTSEATGSVKGTLKVFLDSDIAKNEFATDVPVSFEQFADPGVITWAIFVGLLLLGALLPLALLHALNLYGARFARGEHRLRVLSQEVTVKPHTSVTARNGGALNANYLDAVPVDADPGARELLVGGCECRTIASGSWDERVLSLFRGPYAVATANGEEVLAGAGQHLRVWRDGVVHEVPLALAGTWLFSPTDVKRPEVPLTAEPDAPPPPPTQVDGTLSLVMSAERGARQGEPLLAMAVQQLKTHGWHAPANGEVPESTDGSGDDDWQAEPEEKPGLLSRLRPRRAPKDDPWAEVGEPRGSDPFRPAPAAAEAPKDEDPPPSDGGQRF